MKELIRNILMESTFFRRRVDTRLVEKEFYENLNRLTDSVIYKLEQGKSVDFDAFKRIVMHNLMDDFHNDLSDGGLNDFPYGEVYDFLLNLFHDKIKDRYDLIVRRNINESVPSQVKRRHQNFDDMFVAKRKRLICDYRTPEYLFNGLLESTLEDLYFSLFVDSVTYEEWEESVKYIEKYLTKKYYNETSKMWQKKCKGRLYESEQSTSKKINVAVNIIENEFSDIVRSVEVIEYFNTPTIIVKVDTDDGAGNVTVWITEEMINVVSEITSGKVKLDYWYTGDKNSEILLRVFKINPEKNLTESEGKISSTLHKLLDMLFDGFDDIYYDWANYNCGMGECCDPYAIGFSLPNRDYDDYIFKLVDGEMYDDDGDYPKEFQDELPEVCYESPNIKNPDFDTIVFYGYYAEEIEEYMGHPHNWNLDLLKIINNQFGCDAKRIIII